jgi:hypothetical protein
MLLALLLFAAQDSEAFGIGDFPVSTNIDWCRAEFLPFLDESEPEVSGGQAASPVFGHPHDSFGGFFGTHGSSTAWREFVWDDYLTQPAVLIPLGIGASAAIISHWDKHLEKQLRGTLGSKQTLSNVTLYTLLGGSLLSGVLFPGPGRNSWDQLFNEGEALGASALTTWALKETVRRPRPFEGGGSVHSFPSGHSSGAFTAATLIERNSGEWAAIPAYALAALTAYGRVSSARHYPSDVLAGAAIGILTARIFDGLHWGVDEKGGIARPSVELSVGFREERGVLLQVGVGF